MESSEKNEDNELVVTSKSASTTMASKSESLNSVLKTKDNIGNLIDEIEALSKYYLIF